jgi:hypothetical protein
VPAWAALTEQPLIPSGVMVCLHVLARTGRAVCRCSRASFDLSLGYTAIPLLCAGWLCTQERRNLEVAIIFVAAARYRRATAGRSHDDAESDNSVLQTGAARPHAGFMASLFIISPRMGHGSSQVFEMLPACSCISWACAFRAGDDASIYFSGPVEAEGRHKCPVSTGLLFWDRISNLFLVKKMCIATALALNRSAHRRSGKG